MKVLKSKLTKSGVVVNIMEASEGKKEFFAMSKRYWIGYGDGSPRTCVNRSDSLKYVEKKFAEIR